MLHRSLVTIAVALALSTSAWAQDPPKPPSEPKPPAGPEKKEDSSSSSSSQEVINDSAGDAATLLRNNEKALADKDAKVRAMALEAFYKHRNEAYVKPLAHLLKDKDDTVAKAAAKALGNQPFPHAIDALLDFSSDPKNVAANVETAAEAIRGLGKVGLGKMGYERLRPVFDNADKAVKTAMCEAFAAQKEKKAFSFFVDHCDEPRGDPKDPNLPPPSYWKARFEEWNEYKLFVKKGLKEITGEVFPLAKQYMDWANSAAAKKLGLAYKKGG